MATFRASNAEALYLGQTQGSRAGTTRGDEANADLNCIKSVYTVDGSEAVGDTIEITAGLRQGQVVVPSMSQVVIPVAVGTLQANIGSPSNTSSLATTVGLGGQGIRDLGFQDTDLETVPAGEKVIATVTTATGLTAGTTITFYIVTRSI